MDGKRKNDLLQLLEKLWSESESKLKVTFKNSFIGGLKAGGGTVIGGLLGGPPGMAVGAVIGGIYGWMTSEEFRPLPQILNEMSRDQLDELLKSVMVILGHLTWKTVEELIGYVMTHIPVKNAITDLLKRTVKNLRAGVP